MNQFSEIDAKIAANNAKIAHNNLQMEKLKKALRKDYIQQLGKIYKKFNSLNIKTHELLHSENKNEQKSLGKMNTQKGLKNVKEDLEKLRILAKEQNFYGIHRAIESIIFSVNFDIKCLENN